MDTPWKSNEYGGPLPFKKKRGEMEQWNYKEEPGTSGPSDTTLSMVGSLLHILPFKVNINMNMCNITSQPPSALPLLLPQEAQGSQEVLPTPSSSSLLKGQGQHLLW